MAALRYAPELRGVFAFDEFKLAVELRKRPPWEPGAGAWVPRACTDNDERLSAEWLQRQDIFVSDIIAAAAIETVAREHRYHPVRANMESTPWDQKPRLETALPRYFGAADNSYTRAVFMRSLISGVARVYQPGCKADAVLIFEGDQGIGKSRAVAVLGGPYFTDRLSDFHSKDAAIELVGVHLVELAELDGLSKAEVSTAKAFISRTSDRFRPPYGRRVVDNPRQCFFAGTVNPGGGYLRDPTGARRFWPVRCGKAIDVQSLIADRDQLWAEALACYRAGQPWWLDSPELEDLAAAEQAARFRGDPWDHSIETYVRGKDDVSVPEILEALGVEQARWTQIDQNRVVSHLIAAGFAQYRARDGEARSYRYRRQSAPPS